MLEHGVKPGAFLNQCTLYLFDYCVLTYQPDDNRVVAHLGCCMQRCHPIVGSDARVRPTIIDQVLDNLQVTLLAGQVEWRGTILSL